MIPVEHFMILGSMLFAIGLIIVMVKKSAIVILIGIELMLNASNLNLVAFSRLDENFMTGQVFALFVIVLAAIEAAVALAIVINVYRKFSTSEIDQINQLKD